MDAQKVTDSNISGEFGQAIVCILRLKRSRAKIQRREDQTNLMCRRSVPKKWYD